MRTTRTTLTALALSTGLLLTACGGDDGGGRDLGGDDTTGTDATESTSGGTGDGAGTSEGSIAISGSSTVEPISSIVADEFNAAGSPAQITVEGPGTGDGFERFCADEIDISDASRPIKEEEAATCEAAGIEYIELEIAFDGITVLTSANNDAVTCLSDADLYALIGPESEGFDSWADAQALATELGSSTELPDAPLEITAPGSESGTYDAFVELALGDPTDARVEAGAITEDQAGTTRTDYSSQADDNAIISGIEGSDTSLGWVGFAFAEGAGDAVKELEVDGGDGCVAPSIETIADGSYPLSRSLYIYVNAARAESNPALAEFVDFYLGDQALGALVEEVGYVPLPEDRAAATRERWDARTTGTAAG